MKTIGGYGYFFGVGSVALNFLHMQFIILACIDTWGESVGWAIRNGLISKCRRRVRLWVNPLLFDEPCHQ